MSALTLEEAGFITNGIEPMANGKIFETEEQAETDLKGGEWSQDKHYKTWTRDFGPGRFGIATICLTAGFKYKISVEVFNKSDLLSWMSNK